MAKHSWALVRHPAVIAIISGLIAGNLILFSSQSADLSVAALAILLLGACISGACVPLGLKKAAMGAITFGVVSPVTAWVIVVVAWSIELSDSLRFPSMGEWLLPAVLALVLVLVALAVSGIRALRRQGRTETSALAANT